MTTITFDTLKFANTLKTAGTPHAQAEAEASALADVFNANLQNLVTREDLQRELQIMEQRLVIKLGTLIAAAVGIVAALVKLL